MSEQKTKAENSDQINNVIKINFMSGHRKLCELGSNKVGFFIDEQNSKDHEIKTSLNVYGWGSDKGATVNIRVKEDKEIQVGGDGYLIMVPKASNNPHNQFILSGEEAAWYFKSLIGNRQFFVRREIDQISIGTGKGAKQVGVYFLKADNTQKDAFQVTFAGDNPS